ncbi:MAG: hypothetical protein NWS56_00360, partial [Haliea sp.]|nr:hypothetical protein [Haliea sp.]
MSSSEPRCQARLEALYASLDQVNWSTIIYSANQPFSPNKNSLLQLLQTIKIRQPKAKPVTFGGYINT